LVRGILPRGAVGCLSHSFLQESRHCTSRRQEGRSNTTGRQRYHRGKHWSMGAFSVGQFHSNQSSEAACSLLGCSHDSGCMDNSSPHTGPPGTRALQLPRLLAVLQAATAAPPPQPVTVHVQAPPQDGMCAKAVSVFTSSGSARGHIDKNFKNLNIPSLTY
jgi:hypothetical protein